MRMTCPRRQNCSKRSFRAQARAVTSLVRSSRASWTPARPRTRLWRRQSFQRRRLSRWAWLVVNGCKDIENRIWATHHRGLHAGSSTADLHVDVKEYIERKYGVKMPETFDMGAIVGVVDIVDCVTSHRSPWYHKQGFGWVLAKPRRLPIKPCKGKLKIFAPDL